MILLISIVTIILLLPTKSNKPICKNLIDFGSKKGAIISISLSIISFTIFAIVPNIYNSHSILFLNIILLLFFSLGLTCKNAIFNYISTKDWYNWRKISFIINHIGVFIVIISLFFGSADTHEYKQQGFINKKSPIVFEKESFNSSDYKIHTLPFSIMVNNFSIINDKKGFVTDYKTQLSILNNSDTTLILSSTNSPAHFNGYDIYINSYDTSSEPKYVVLSINYHPWKTITYSGITLMIIGAILMFLLSTKKNLNNE